jgi:hypothetical protein
MGVGAGVLGMALRRGGLAVEIGDEQGKGALYARDLISRGRFGPGIHTVGCTSYA